MAMVAWLAERGPDGSRGLYWWAIADRVGLA